MKIKLKHRPQICLERSQAGSQPETRIGEIVCVEAHGFSLC